MSLQSQLEQALRDAIRRALGVDADPLLSPATNPKFGDFQANAAMSLAKQLGQKPREIAEKIVATLPPGVPASAGMSPGSPSGESTPGSVLSLIARADIAGPGFINLTLTDAAVAHHAAAMLADDRLGVLPAQPTQKVVVDYSGPNVAKEMHIGHLRSTIIGDAIARVLGALGHDVARQNHLGDWGTQFGMLLQHLDETAAGNELHIADLNVFYQQAKQRFDEDAAFADRARRRVVALQSGDATTVARWEQLVAESAHHFNDAYARLNVLLTDGDIRGESAYNDDLPGVVETLGKAGILKESEGAAVVYPDGFRGKDGEPMPMIVRKSDGGYLYATTDLAALRYRIERLHADRIIYVTDARQSQHFAMIFQTAKQLGWSEGVRLDHVPFGTILGPDRKPFKTRTGGTVKLADVLDEAVERAGRAIAAKNPDLPPQERQRAAEVIGVGAMKYFDLSSDRVKDYVFDYDRMLSLEGNTGPYLVYAYVRIRSIFRKHGREVPTGGIRLAHEAERTVALKLLQFPGIIAAVAETLEPHRLCTYMYELASSYHHFFEHCPVLKAEDEATRDSRLRLSDLVARTLKQGLSLLGIGTVEQM